MRSPGGRRARMVRARGPNWRAPCLDVLEPRRLLQADGLVGDSGALPMLPEGSWSTWEAGAAAERLSGDKGSGSVASTSVRAWPDTTVTFSFMPDGTWLVTDREAQSVLSATLTSQFGPPEIWQREFALALQWWAEVTPLNFVLVADDGSPFNAQGLAQHDPRFGDIRFGAYALDGPGGVLGQGYLPSVSGTTSSGDVQLDSSENWSRTGAVDLFTAVLHEVGHALGLSHSGADEVMGAVYAGPRPGLTAADIAAIQRIYGARRPDRFAGNTSLATASDISAEYDSEMQLSVTGDVTVPGEVDYFRFAAPASGPLRVQVSGSGRSLLDAALLVVDGNGEVLAMSDSQGYGLAESVTVDVVAGRTYFVLAGGAGYSPLAVGAYELWIRPDTSARAASGILAETDTSCRGARFSLVASRRTVVWAELEESGRYSGAVLRVVNRRSRDAAAGGGSLRMSPRAGRPLQFDVYCPDQAKPSDVASIQIVLDRSGKLRITGSDGDDQIQAASFNEITIDGVLFRFQSSRVGELEISGGAGDDFVLIGGGAVGNTALAGGDGDDTLIGGCGQDSILGGLGSDVLIGGQGNDLLDGGAGDDAVADGLGNDRVSSLVGQDIWVWGHGADEVAGAPREAPWLASPLPPKLVDLLPLSQLLSLFQTCTLK